MGDHEQAFVGSGYVGEHLRSPAGDRGILIIFHVLNPHTGLPKFRELMPQPREEAWPPFFQQIPQTGYIGRVAAMAPGRDGVLPRIALEIQ